jgi:hypothetical protein
MSACVEILDWTQLARGAHITIVFDRVRKADKAHLGRHVGFDPDHSATLLARAFNRVVRSRFERTASGNLL